MPLSSRQKRRLLEISKMIESSIVVKDDMEEIQLEYAQEIEGVIQQIAAEIIKQEPDVDSQNKLTLRSKTWKNVEEARARRKQKKLEQEARDSYVPPSKPEVEDAPEWAKRLWKGIAKKCHPDRLSFQELNAIQIARRQIWFLEAKSLFEQRSWPKLIHIGVQVGEYVDEISHKEQLVWLNNEYESLSTKISGFQTTLAWQWGTNWENIDLRVNILSTVLQHRRINVPERQELVKLIIKLEQD